MTLMEMVLGRAFLLIEQNGAYIDEVTILKDLGCPTELCLPEEGGILVTYKSGS